MKLSSLCLLLSTLLFLFSCQKDDSISDSDNFTGIDSRLVKYFDKFESAGATRGFEIDLEAEGFGGAIQKIEGSAGKCFYGSHATPNVIIDIDYWNNADEMNRELMVFHELGHCYLQRGHMEDRMGDGICMSIMRSGDGSCFDNYTNDTRDYYLDELFSN